VVDFTAGFFILLSSPLEKGADTPHSICSQDVFLVMRFLYT